MKRIILLSLIALVSFTACKKKKKEVKVKPITQIITDRGTWLTVNEIHQYYDVNNTLIFSETIQSGPTYKFSKTSNELKVVYPNKTENKIYQFSITDNKQFVSLTYNTEVSTWQVLSATSTDMQWQRIENNVSFASNGQQQTAAKKVTTINFHCPCE
jgi:hypothetical protein